MLAARQSKQVKNQSRVHNPWLCFASLISRAHYLASVGSAVKITPAKTKNLSLPKTSTDRIRRFLGREVRTSVLRLILLSFIWLFLSGVKDSMFIWSDKTNIDFSSEVPFGLRRSSLNTLRYWKNLYTLRVLLTSRTTSTGNVSSCIVFTISLS